VGRIRHAHQEQRGLVAVMTALMMVLMLAVVAVVVDLGNARQERRAAQNGADAAALAAGETIEAGNGIINWSALVTQVKTYARVNDGVSTSAWVGCSDPYALSYHPDASNNDTCISADLSAWPAASAATVGDTVNHVRVRLPSSTVRSLFARAVGNGDLTVGAAATAKTVMTVKPITTSTTVAGGPCALCVLGSGFTLDGQNGDVTITGGNVIVNSTYTGGACNCAAKLNPGGNVKITTSGGAIGGPGAPNNFSGSGFSPAPTLLGAVVDPLASVPQCGDGSKADGTPAVPDPCPTNIVSNASPTNLSPGIYTKISGTHTLSPGIYVITGTSQKPEEGLVLSGNDVITGDGVMLYFACSNYPAPCPSNGGAGTTGARIKATGNGKFALQLTAPTSGTYKGLLVFADRSNNATQTWRGNGTNESGGASGSSGTIYLKSGQMDLRGNGYTLSSQIIADRFTMNGNPSTVVIAYDLSKNATETTTTTKTDYVPNYDDNGLSG
jgi:hypothetical protein